MLGRTENQLKKSTKCGQLGRTLDDKEALYVFPQELTADDFSLRQVFRKTETKGTQFEFQLISPVEFSLRLSRSCDKLRKLLDDKIFDENFNYHAERHSYFFSIKYYSHIRANIKVIMDLIDWPLSHPLSVQNWHESGADDFTANYNGFDSDLIKILKKNITQNDSIMTFIQNPKKTRRQLIESLKFDPKYKKTIEMMSKKNMFEEMYDNQLIAFYMTVIRQGKCILADGLGKTLSAITAMTYFRKDWPLVIVCATERKPYWANKMYDWNRKFDMKLKITVITSIKEIYTYPEIFHDIMIIDYDTYYEAKDTISYKCIGLKAYIFEDQTRGTDRRRQWKDLSKCYNNLKNVNRIIFIWAVEFESDKYRRLFPLLSILDPETYAEAYYEDFENKYCAFDDEEESPEEKRRQIEFQIILRSTFLIKASSKDIPKDSSDVP